MKTDTLVVSMLLDLLVGVHHARRDVATINADLREMQPVQPSDSMDALSNDISAPPPAEMPTTNARPVTVVMHAQR